MRRLDGLASVLSRIARAMGREPARDHQRVRQLCETSGLFDRAFYLSQNPHVAESGEDPLDHFVQQGALEGRNPNPFFDIAFYSQHPGVLDGGQNPIAHYVLEGASRGLASSPEFDTAFYLARHPDVAASGVNPLAHYLAHGWREGRVARAPAAYAQLRALWGEAARIDPSIAGSIPSPEALPLKTTRPSRVGEAFLALSQQIDQPFQHFVVLDTLDDDEISRHAVNLISQLSERPGPRSVLVLLVGSDTPLSTRLPRTVRVVSMRDAASPLDRREKAYLLAQLTLNWKPRWVHAIESPECWDSFETYGRPLALHTKLGVSLLRREFDRDGVPMGSAARALPRLFESVHHVVLDNATLREELISQFAIQAPITDRLKVVYQIAEEPGSDTGEEGAAAEASTPFGQLSVLWAGPLVWQRRADVLQRIAEACPWAEFHVWSRPTSKGNVAEPPPSAPNLRIHGEYSSVSALLRGRHHCYLHTCESGGLPLQLLAAAAAGVPLVAPRVGGIPELVNETTGFLVERADDVSGFVRCLETIRRSPEDAMNRSRRASELVRQRHSRAAFARAVAALFV